MATRTLTGNLAIIKKGGIVIGKMRNVRIQEQTTRGRVGQLGSARAVERPALAFNGTLTCSFFEISYSKSGIPDAFRRDGDSIQDIEDQFLLDNEGVQIDIFKKGADARDPDTGKYNPNAVPYATVPGCQIEGDNVDIQMNDLAGRDQTFVFSDPIRITSVENNTAEE